MDNIKKYAPYLLLILPAIAFVAAGGAKLAGVEEVLASFSLMGMPSWFGTFIGACEVAGGLALVFLPALRKLAAAGLALIMLGAIYFHVAYSVPSPVPAIVLLLFMIVIMARNWNKSAAAA
ncbi:MAG: DoxX family protein [Pseudomonadota bacterium]